MANMLPEMLFLLLAFAIGALSYREVSSPVLIPAFIVLLPKLHLRKGY